MRKTFLALLLLAASVTGQTLRLDSGSYGLKLDGSDEGAWFNQVVEQLTRQKYSKLQIRGTLGTTVPITWVGPGVADGLKVVELELTVRALGPIDDYLVTIQGFINAEFRGQLHVRGTGGNSYKGRTVDSGLRITNCERSRFGYILATAFREYGLVLDSRAGNTTMCHIEKYKPFDCGGGIAGTVRAIPGTWANPRHSGGSGSIGQQTTITLADVEPSEQTRFCNIDGELHHVLEVSGRTIAVYPWVDLERQSGDIWLYTGGGLRIVGSDSNNHVIQAIDATGCAVALDISSPYGPNVGQLQTQADAVAVCFGLHRSGTHTSTFINNLYCEDNDFDIVQLTTAAISSRVGTSYATDLAKCVAFAPRLSNNQFSDAFLRFRGLELRNFGKTLDETGDNPNGLTGSLIRLRPGPDQSSVAHAFANNQRVSLEVNERHHALFGYSRATILAHGSGEHGQPTGEWSFEVPPGHLVNGGAEIALQFERPTIVYAVYRGRKRWHVYAFPLSMPSPVR